MSFVAPGTDGGEGGGGEGGGGNKEGQTRRIMSRVMGSPGRGRKAIELSKFTNCVAVDSVHDLSRPGAI